MPALLSTDFQRLYCDAAIFENFSAQHPINLKRVLPFQPQDMVRDDPHVLDAELAILADRNDDTRRAVADAYALCGLMSREEAVNLKPVVDYFDADFFDVMGLVYANAGMYICALRWYREHLVQLETKDPYWRSDETGVHASIGYCLYALGMFEEAVAWTKSCIGLRLVTDTACRALVENEAQQAGGSLFAIERATNRARYTIVAPDPGNVAAICAQLKTATSAVAPFQESYINWMSPDEPAPQSQDGYPFSVERDSSNFMRHKMNLLFALCGTADALISRSCTGEANRLLSEAAVLEPRAEFIQERLKAIR